MTNLKKGTGQRFTTDFLKKASKKLKNTVIHKDLKRKEPASRVLSKKIH